MLSRRIPHLSISWRSSFRFHKQLKQSPVNSEWQFKTFHLEKSNLFGSKREYSSHHYRFFEKPNPKGNHWFHYAAGALLAAILFTEKKEEDSSISDDAYHYYFKNPRPDQFIQIIEKTFSNGFEEYYEQAPEYIRDSTFFNPELHYVYTIIGFMSEVFRQNPEKVLGWCEEIPDRDFFRNELENSKVFLAIASFLSDTEQGDYFVKSLFTVDDVDPSVQNLFQSIREVVETTGINTHNLNTKNLRESGFKYLERKKKDTLFQTSCLIGEYKANGNPDLIKKMLQFSDENLRESSPERQVHRLIYEYIKASVYQLKFHPELKQLIFEEAERLNNPELQFLVKEVL